MKIQIIKDKIRSDYYVVSKMDNREIGTIEKRMYQGEIEWSVYIQPNRNSCLINNFVDFEVACDSVIRFMEEF